MCESYNRHNSSFNFSSTFLLDSMRYVVVFYHCSSAMEMKKSRLCSRRSILKRCYYLIVTMCVLIKFFVVVDKLELLKSIE